MQFKKYSACLSLAFVLASCGTTVPTETSSSSQIDSSSQASQMPSDSSLQAQATTCNYYLNNVRYSSCDQYQYNAVLTAGDIFRKSNLVGSERILTIAVAKNNNELIVAVNGGANVTAANKVRNETLRRGGTFVDPGGTTHAEQAITDRYAMFNGRIGISNPNGPCPTCRGNIRGISISWFPNFYW